jgi:hypothetical protein
LATETGAERYFQITPAHTPPTQTTNPARREEDRHTVGENRIRESWAEIPAVGTPQELANIELSPFGVHWPNLDEALSIHGILA